MADDNKAGGGELNDNNTQEEMDVGNEKDPEKCVVNGGENGVRNSEEKLTVADNDEGMEDLEESKTEGAEDERCLTQEETLVEFHDEATAGESTEVAETEDKPYETPFEIEDTKKSGLHEVEPTDKNPAREEITENIEEKENLRPASIEKNEHPQECLSVSAAKEAETENNLENEVASPQDAKKSLEDTDKSPLNAEISTESTNKSPDDAEESPRSAEKSPHVVKISSQSAEKSSLRLDQSPYRSVISPYRSESSGKPEEDDAPIEKRVKLSSVEIRIPNLKAQLNNIIKETEETVQAPPPVEDSEEVQEIGEDGQVYHTWRPKGRYELEHTEIMREEVVPISVSDVPEPPPVVQQQSEPQPEPDAAERDEQQQQQQQLGEGGPLIIQTHLPNGELGSPIEIPEGIPLLARILPPEEDSSREKIPLERLFTPATDSGEITPRKKKKVP
ncbi:pinin, partial [Hyalella azteca]|uniref:Pinin n=1 Tax=Hyalella azteca TaxID=294128 RepID=A0A979FK03_HYAAZ